MIREAAAIGVVLVNDEAALLIEQSVEDTGYLVGRRGGHLRMEGRKLIGKMRLELHARPLAVVQIYEAPDFTAPPRQALALMPD